MKKIALKGLSSKERAASYQEVKLLQALRHPYIVSYYESFTERATNTLCIVMTYCAGGDLHSRLKSLAKRGQLLREEQILRWTLQMTLALQYIHERHSIIHRDLKVSTASAGHNTAVARQPTQMGHAIAFAGRPACARINGVNLMSFVFGMRLKSSLASIMVVNGSLEVSICATVCG